MKSIKKDYEKKKGITVKQTTGSQYITHISLTKSLHNRQENLLLVPIQI